MSVSFLIFGIDVVQDPSISTTPGAGNDGAGQISLTGGTQIFGDGQVIEVTLESVDANGEVSGSSDIISLTVYNNTADYLAGTALYTYEPATPGVFAQVPDDLSNIGDTYLKFDASMLVSADAGAPALSALFMAPGSDANDSYGSLTIDRDTDVDYDGDLGIDPGTIEEGNTHFNIAFPEHVYGPVSDGLVSGTAGDDTMGLGYVDPSDGDVITTGGDQIDGNIGNDTIDGDAGDDGVFGGDGDDSITGGAGNDWVLGEGGDDTITLSDGFGDDTIIGGATDETEGDLLDAGAVTADLTVDLRGTDSQAGSVSDGTDTAGFTQIERVGLGSGNDTVILGDGGGARVVQGFVAPLDNSDGTYSGVDVLDVSGLTDGGGDPIDTGDVSLSDDGDGNAVLGFPNGESLTLVGIDPGDINSRAALVAMGIPGGRDYIVSGTTGDDWISEFYVDDPDGDMIDAGDALDGSNDDHVQAGLGDDTVLGGAGDDSIEGGDGNDQLEGGDDNDTLIGGEGADYLYGNTGDDVGFGGDGNDSFEGYDGDDYVEGGAGDDRLEGDRGNDTILGGEGNDWLRGSYGSDYMEGGEGDDFIWSGYNDDTIVLEDNFGNDTIEMEGQDEVDGDVLDLSRITSDLVIDLSSDVQGRGTLSDGTSTATFESVENLILGSGVNTIRLGYISGNDRVIGFDAPTDNGDGTFTGQDFLDLSNMQDADGNPVDTSDVIVTDDGDGNALLSFGNGETLTLVGVAPDDVSSAAQLHAMGIPMGASDGIVEGSSSDDLIDDAYTGDPEGDMVDGGDGAGGSDADWIEAGAGNDTILGGAEGDSIFGGDGNDLIDGEDGDDRIHGDAGDDTISVGAGDQATGGDGDDVFNVAATGGGTMHVDGSEDAEVTGDTLNITGPATITYDADPENGRVEWQDGTTLTFENIENVNYVPCFTPHSMIKTIRGEVPAGHLRLGDRVLTRDNGFQAIEWIGARNLTCTKTHRPVRIRKGALGNGQPERDLLVSPQHRMLVCSKTAALWFGEEEVFVPAISLTIMDGIEQLKMPRVSYVHFMMERHQVVMGDGAWSESFQPGDLTLSGMDQAQRAELFDLFPELATRETAGVYPAARITLAAHEAKLLAG
ncbi:MAG: Hint domain-containing protein [Thalassovita sp.]